MFFVRFIIRFREMGSRLRVDVSQADNNVASPFAALLRHSGIRCAHFLRRCEIRVLEFRKGLRHVGYWRLAWLRFTKEWCRV